jgi:hypothetical protein
MATILALQDLYDRVVADFANKAPSVVFNFGSRSIPRAATTTSGTIDIVPGDESGNIGSFVMPREVGSSPRHLYDILENFTVYVRGFDLDRENQLKQYAATMLLAQSLIASARDAVPGNVQFTGWKWNLAHGERRTAEQIIISCVLRSPIPDFQFGYGIDGYVTAEINQALGNDDPNSAGTILMVEPIPTQINFNDGYTVKTYYVPPL